MDSEIKYLCELLQRTFEKNSWHGPAVMEVLEGVTEDESLKKLPDSHSILSLVGHMTAWRVFAIKKLQGDKDYAVPKEGNFPLDIGWAKAIEDLKKSQQVLLEQIQGMNSARLQEVVPHGSYTYTYYRLLHGIIHHDLYHIGQIVLLKKQSI